jgi:hypothetical protein
LNAGRMKVRMDEGSLSSTAAKVLAKSFSSPDEVRTFEKGKVEIVKLGDVIIGRGTLEPGWSWSKCIKPLAGTNSCKAPHTFTKSQEE